MLAIKKSSRIRPILEFILPEAQVIEIAELSELQRYYAGLGSPALRIGYNALSVSCDIDLSACSSLDSLARQAPARQVKSAAEFTEFYQAVRSCALELSQEGSEDREDVADALVDLGWFWLNGFFVKQDEALANRLFRLAAGLGSATATFNLGVIADYGKAGAVDTVAALAFYQEAYFAGFELAAESLGNLYDDQSLPEVQRNEKLAARWYGRAVRTGSSQAKLSLGELLTRPGSPAFDLQRGLYFLQEAAMEGREAAAVKIVELIKYGFLTDPHDRLLQFWASQISIVQ